MLLKRESLNIPELSFISIEINNALSDLYFIIKLQRAPPRFLGTTGLNFKNERKKQGRVGLYLLGHVCSNNPCAVHSLTFFLQNLCVK
jgi:hypothetical protein